MNPPVGLPRNTPGTTPARSNASHDTSSNNRCCGSIANASRGEIPKNPASKPAAPYKNPPRRVYDLPTTPGSESNNPPRSQPRSTGKSPTTSPPATTNPHKSSGEPTPPGKRHPIPTIATG